jgi:hypothetical protein
VAPLTTVKKENLAFAETVTEPGLLMTNPLLSLVPTPGVLMMIAPVMVVGKELPVTCMVEEPSALYTYVAAPLSVRVPETRKLPLEVELAIPFVEPICKLPVLFSVNEPAPPINVVTVAGKITFPFIVAAVVTLMLVVEAAPKLNVAPLFTVKLLTVTVLEAMVEAPVALVLPITKLPYVAVVID